MRTANSEIDGRCKTERARDCALEPADRFRVNRRWEGKGYVDRACGSGGKHGHTVGAPPKHSTDAADGTASERVGRRAAAAGEEEAALGRDARRRRHGPWKERAEALKEGFGAWRRAG